VLFIFGVLFCLYMSSASVKRVDVISTSCVDCKGFVDGITEALHAQVREVIRYAR